MLGRLCSRFSVLKSFSYAQNGGFRPFPNPRMWKLTDSVVSNASYQISSDFHPIFQGYDLSTIRPNSVTCMKLRNFRLYVFFIDAGKSVVGAIFHDKPAPKQWMGRGTSFKQRSILMASRWYARGDRKKGYNLFKEGVPGSKEFRQAWTKQLDEDDCVWTGSEDESDSEKKTTPLEKEIKKIKQKAKEHSERIDADDSDELWSVWSGSDEEKTLWTGAEEDSEDDTPTEAYPNEKSDAYIDKLFEFDEPPKYRTISELLKAENEPEELSPGKKARKLAVENALKKLKKGPDGRYINVLEVMSDIDILIGAFERIVEGPEYAELRKGGAKKLNMEFFKDIQAKMRDPNYQFSPEMKLKPKSKLVSKKKWQKAQSRRRKAQKR